MDKTCLEAAVRAATSHGITTPAPNDGESDRWLGDLAFLQLRVESLFLPTQTQPHPAGPNRRYEYCRLRDSKQRSAAARKRRDKKFATSSSLARPRQSLFRPPQNTKHYANWLSIRPSSPIREIHYIAATDQTRQNGEQCLKSHSASSPGPGKLHRLSS